MKRKRQKPIQLTRSVLDSLVPDSAPLYTLLSCRPELAERLEQEGCLTVPFLLPRQVPPGLARVVRLDRALPVLLDTVQLPLPQLVDVLLMLRTTEHRAVALVELTDRRTQRLLMLCPMVETILADREEQIWAGLAEPRLPLVTLDLLHALPAVAQLRQLTEASGLSRLAIFQGISDLEAMLGVTLGRANSAPALLYERIVPWLAAPHRPRPHTPHDPAELPSYQITNDGRLRAPALAATEPPQSDTVFCWGRLPLPEPRQAPLHTAHEQAQLEAHRRKGRERYEQKLATMTEEQREEHHRKHRERYYQQRARMTEEQRQEKNRQAREHYHQQRTKQSQQERTDD